MIDPKNDSLGFLLARYVQHHERVLTLLEFLAARLDAQGQEDFLVLLGDQAKAEAQADLEAAAVEAQAAGLDAVQITTDVTVVKAMAEPPAEPLPVVEVKPL
jgi:hypothetical protein